MAEYIEREALKKVLTRYLNAPHVQMVHSVGQGMRIAIKSCIELLDNEYAADVEPVRHGRWNPDGSCSKCGEYDNKDPYGSKYCPNCGAKMNGGQNNESY